MVSYTCTTNYTAKIMVSYTTHYTTQFPTHYTTKIMVSYTTHFTAHYTTSTMVSPATPTPPITPPTTPCQSW